MVFLIQILVLIIALDLLTALANFLLGSHFGDLLKINIILITK